MQREKKSPGRVHKTDEDVSSNYRGHKKGQTLYMKQTRKGSKSTSTMDA